MLAPHKKIMRVITHTGLVDVTDEHSLLDADGIMVNASNVGIGDKLLHFREYPQLSNNYTKISPTEARILGMFCGDGSCGIYNCLTGIKATWAINNSDIITLLRYKRLCEKVYSNYTWVIMDTFENSKIYKLSPRGLNAEISSLCAYFRLLMYKQQEKIVPQEILNSDRDTRQAFFDGLYDAARRSRATPREPDGNKQYKHLGTKMLLHGGRIDQKHQVTIASLAMLASSLGYNISLNTRYDKPNIFIFRLTFTKKTQKRNPIAIKKKYYIEYTGYVYDLTTKNHHFQAGPGQMIVHNTDSCMLWHENSNPDESKKVGMQICDDITSALPEPMALKFECYCEKIILLTKKRYVLVSNNKVSYKGVMNARRDYCKFAKDTYSHIMKMIAETGSSNEKICLKCVREKHC